MIALTKSRCIICDLMTRHLVSWIRGSLDVSDSLIIEHQMLLCSYCVVVLLEVLLIFVEVVQFLVQWLIEQLEILQASLGIDVFPEPILASADVVLRKKKTLLLRNVFRV